MHRPELTLALALVPVTAGLADAQMPAVLRFRPPPGQVLRTVTEVRTRMTLTGFPSVPDSAVADEEMWTSATQRVGAADGAGTALVVVVDSVRGRHRLAGEPWTDATDSIPVGWPARVVVSERFAFLDAPGDPEVLQVLGALVIGGGLGFPESQVGPGAAIPAAGLVRTRVRTDPAWGIAINDLVTGPLALTLDSVVGDGADANAYFHFQGNFDPRTIAAGSEAGDRVATYRGGFAGRLVWSERWGAIVSAVVRLRVDGRIRVEGPRGVVDAQATVDRTVLHRLRL